MLLSDFITVALIPTLIQNSNSSEVDNPFNSDRSQNGNSRALLNSRRLPLPRSSEEDIFGNDEFFSSNNNAVPGPFSSPYKIQGKERQQQPIIRDPILREIYEEEKRLDLAGGDLDMSSEEARELITFQRKKMNMMQNFARQAGAVVGIPPQTVPQGRSMFSGPRVNNQQTMMRSTSTEYPILIPTTTTSPPLQEETNEAAEISEPTSEKPSTGRLGIGGVFGKVRSGVGGAITSVHRKIFGGGSNTPETTTSTPRPSPNNVYFPEDDDKSSRRPSQGSNSIVFEEDSETTTAAPLNCTGVKTEYNGACYNVLQQLPCPAGQWLIEDDNTGKGRCVENKCSNTPNTAFFGGKCVVVRSEGDHCHKGMVTYIFKNGEVECDCKDQYLFNQRDGNCYPAYRRGPCHAGEIFATRLTSKGVLPASCIRNKCTKDGFFCNAPSCPKDRNCIELKSKCATGIWDIHPDKLSPACIDFDVYKPDRIIGNVPTLACAPGSRRDILGTCRKSTKITFS